MELFVLVGALVTVTLCQVEFPTRFCPKPYVVQNFDFSAFSGTWYEIQSYGSPDVVEGEEMCVSVTYTPSRKAGQMNVNEIIITMEPSWEEEIREGKAWLAQPKATPVEGRLEMSLGDDKEVSADYLILETDYTGYAIVWSCRPLPNQKLRHEYAWILSRTPILKHQDEVDGFLSTVDSVIIKRFLQTTNQDSDVCSFLQPFTTGTAEPSIEEPKTPEYFYGGNEIDTSAVATPFPNETCTGFGCIFKLLNYTYIEKLTINVFNNTFINMTYS